MGRKELVKVAEEIGISALDTVFIPMLTDFFKGFPIVSSTIKVLKALASIPDVLYLNKIKGFLDGLRSGTMDGDAFHKAIIELNRDNEKFQKTLLYLIEKAEDEEKAKLLGRFTQLFAQKKISYDEYLNFVHVANNIQMQYLEQYSKMYSNYSALKKLPLFSILSANGLVLTNDEKPGLKIGDSVVIPGNELSSEGFKFGKYLADYFKENLNN